MSMTFEHGEISVKAHGVQAKASQGGRVIHKIEAKTREEAVTLMQKWLKEKHPLPVAVTPIVETAPPVPASTPRLEETEAPKSRKKRYSS